MIINRIRRKKRIEEWRRRDYRISLDYYYAQKLKKYKFDPMKVTVWYVDKEHDYIQFGSHGSYYELRDGKIKEITNQDVWIERNRYDKKSKDTKEPTKKKTSKKDQ